MNDIDLAGKTYTRAVISPDTDNSNWEFDGVAFTGRFDGNGFVIKGLTINTNGHGNDYLGLFGCIGSGGEVVKLGLEGTRITGGTTSEDVGGLCGYNQGVISQCYTTGSIVIVGNETEDIGGLCGLNAGDIDNSFSFASISVGTKSYAVGGLVGYSSFGGSISKSYSVGYVSKSDLSGGLIGENDGLAINSLWDKQSSGLDWSAGGTGKTTAQMKTQSTFTDAGWDFVNIWKMPTVGGYPVLRWQDAGSSTLTISKFTAKAGKTANTDSVSFSGLLQNAALADLESGPYKLGLRFESADMEPFVFSATIGTTFFRNGKFNAKGFNNSYFKGDRKTGKISFSAKKIDLTGLRCPIEVSIVIGNNVGETSIGEDIVNGVKKLCPPQFMIGVKNTMTVSKSKVKFGKRPFTDSFTVSGYFTVEDDTYSKISPVVITLGEQTFTVPCGKFITKKSVESCKKAASEEGPLVDAKFDFDKCTFLITVKNAEINESGVVEFDIDCFGHDLPDQPIDL